ncbi:hypothetical protein RSG63_004177 [Yersinia enterocolitica]|nr:hypothetical protein [Yersinia enterocolitica]ELI8374802.1 hypothetical protein [Yersinia enterocolitica]
MSWYRSGTVTAAAGQNVITGTGTQWANNVMGVAPGQAFIVQRANGNTLIYEILAVDSNTRIRINGNVVDALVASNYGIQTSVSNSYSALARETSAQLALYQQLLEDWQNITTGTGDVTIIAPDGTEVVIPALSWITDSKTWFDTNKELIENAGEAVAGALSNLGLGDASGYVGRLLKIQVFTASGTVTKTPGAKKWRIKCLGAGGGSSAARATGSYDVSVSNGGGSGAYAEGIYDVSSITTESVVIGSGGAGGTAGSIYGGDGGYSSVGSFISSPGGKAGLPAGPETPPFQHVANNNSYGPTGWNIVGSSGAGAEPAVAVANSYATGSRGSNSIFGVGGSTPAINSPANTGDGYGSGASGCSNGLSQPVKSGAAGRPGIIIIEEYA